MTNILLPRSIQHAFDATAEGFQIKHVQMTV
jgi:hypothetical protein